jgi:hypothetical protein
LFGRLLGVRSDDRPQEEAWASVFTGEGVGNILLYEQCPSLLQMRKEEAMTDRKDVAKQALNKLRGGEE